MILIYDYLILMIQLLSLKKKDPNEVNLKKETEGSWSNGSDNNSSDANLDISRAAAITSPVSSHLSSKQLFPSSIRPITMTQPLHHQGSARPDLQCPKMDQMVQEESFCNMFNGIEEQQGFWQWPEQQNFR